MVDHISRASCTETAGTRERCEEEGAHDRVCRFLEQLSHVRFEGVSILLQEMSSLVCDLWWQGWGGRGEEREEEGGEKREGEGEEGRGRGEGRREERERGEGRREGGVKGGGKE